MLLIGHRFFINVIQKQKIIKNTEDTFKNTENTEVTFEEEKIITQYCIENKRIDVYFSEYKLGIEIDEYSHESRNFNYEKSRQLMIESYEITIIRTNPDATDFDINMLINQIYKHIIESTKNQTKVSTKKSLIDDLSKRLLELEFKSNYSTKSKSLKWIAKNILPNYKKSKNIQSKIKPIKIGKQPGKTYCFGCKDYPQNFRPQEVKMTNKVRREKSHCVVC